MNLRSFFTCAHHPTKLNGRAFVVPWELLFDDADISASFTAPDSIPSGVSQTALNTLIYKAKK